MRSCTLCSISCSEALCWTDSNPAERWIDTFSEVFSQHQGKSTFHDIPLLVGGQNSLLLHGDKKGIRKHWNQREQLRCDLCICLGVFISLPIAFLLIFSDFVLLSHSFFDWTIEWSLLPLWCLWIRIVVQSFSTFFQQVYYHQKWMRPIHKWCEIHHGRWLHIYSHYMGSCWVRVFSCSSPCWTWREWN